MLNIFWCVFFFSFFLSICVSFLEKCQFRSSAYFLIGLFVCLHWVSWVVCIFWRLILCQLLHSQIFSPIWGCFFISFMVFFAVQKLLNLIRFYLLIFVFIFIILGSGPKKFLLWFMSKCVLSIFSSKSFIVLGLIFSLYLNLSLFLCMV